MLSVGKVIRLSRIFDQETKRTVIVPLDDALIEGPEGGLRNEGKKIKQVVAGGANAIMAFRGLFERHYTEILHISGLMNVTASTTLSKHTRKVLIGRVEEAVRLGMDGIAVHVNISSDYESEMLRILSEVSRECDMLGMPLMAQMYPRREGSGADYNYYDLKKEQPEKYAELVRHAARVGVELGADIIKTQFTGDSETFHTVVESCYEVPVVIAGGPMVSAEEMLTNAYLAIQAGAAGICFGRNVFHRENSQLFVSVLRKIVHERCSLEEAKQSIQ
jgi:DhnA family fructose-bisphosphate aldolase class Ia